MGAVLRFERHKPRSEPVKYVIAYDICEPRRLRRVAKCLERSAVRVQKSVFIFVGSRQELEAVTGDLMTLIDVAEDRVQAWPVNDSPVIHGWNAGTALPGHVAAVVLCPDGIVYVEPHQ